MKGVVTIERAGPWSRDPNEGGELEREISRSGGQMACAGEAGGVEGRGAGGHLTMPEA